jgi:ABC-type ATPase with predicted acetyltransferase domain
MPKLDFTIATDLSNSPRVRQLAAMFDVPMAEKATLRFQGDLPIDDRPWTVGLIVGASGAGKSSVMRHVWGEPPALRWESKSVIDDFDRSLSMEQICSVCQAVGFNTVPAWMRPYKVLSNGERFRVELARRMLETPADRPIVVDEFTSVVDRQVAKIGAHAVQKWVRKNNRRFVAVTCHYDVIEWLQPDWILEPATMGFARREPADRPFSEAPSAASIAPRGASSVRFTI